MCFCDIIMKQGKENVGPVFNNGYAVSSDVKGRSKTDKQRDRDIREELKTFSV